MHNDLPTDYMSQYARAWRFELRRRRRVAFIRRATWTALALSAAAALYASLPH